MDALRTTTALALLALAGACASAGTAARGPSTTEQPVIVEVTNRNWSNMVVYAVRLGARYRLGTVNSMTTQRFRIPKTLAAASGLRLMADPIGSSRTFVTEPIQVSRGQKIEFTVENLITTSNFAVWNRE